MTDSLCSSMNNNIRVICFDQGGTLLFRTPLEDNGRADYSRIMKITGQLGDPMEFGKKLLGRDKKYKRWSLSSNEEASEEIIWQKWLLPEADEKVTSSNSDELTLLFSHSKGHRVFREDAFSTVKELHSRGYRLGMITNTVSRTLVPLELSREGISPFIETIIMSSLTGVRKPDPEIFISLAEKMAVSPSACVYVGDAPDRDVAGPKKAGYGMSVLLGNESGKNRELASDLYPDIFINKLSDLLNIFNHKKDEVHI
ncbi:MAG: HAD-IA family hydrolase [Spirochaetales bacterium]|nr:HAD-IA family hydrolase [Spirochaetales bacterium]